MAITHLKTDTIPDWTQAELDAQIALGNYPPGTLLADIVLPSDWNAAHTNPDIADVTGLQAALDLKAPLASPTFTGTVTLPAGQVVNGVTLTAAGSASNFLNAAGSYSAVSVVSRGNIGMQLLGATL